jgi:hypothetical protein
MKEMYKSQYKQRMWKLLIEVENDPSIIYSVQVTYI